ncbi:MAG TPA: hypothetical protein PK156_23075, partial [Polyangium sp.]|nr:hypothetical protein [Polyangium sp.]
MKGGEDDDDDTAYEAVTTILSRGAVAAAVQSKLVPPPPPMPRGAFILDEPTMDVSDDAIEVFDERKVISVKTVSATREPVMAEPTRRPLPSTTERIVAPESMPEPPTVPRRGSVPPPPMAPVVKAPEPEAAGPRRGSVPPPPPPVAGLAGKTGTTTIPRPASVPPPPPTATGTPQNPLRLPSRQITAIPGLMPAVIPRPAS